MSVGTNGNLPKRKPPGSRPIVTAATLPPGGGRPLVEHIDTFVARVQAYFSKLYLNPDEAYKQTRDHGASMRRDPVVMEPLRQRQLATALLDFQICPEDEGDVIQKAVCEDLKLCVQRTPYWTKMLMCLQEAIWFGKYAVNMYGYHWDRFNPWRMLPGEWIPVHGDKLKFEHETGRVGIRISSLANLSDRSDFRIDTEGRVVMVPDEWLSAGDRKALIVHKHEIEDGDFFDATTAGSIHGVGLRTRVYWPWFFKQKAVQWLMSWAEQVGLGVKIWYFEQSNPESEAAVRRAAEQNNENMNILMPRSIGTEGQGAGLELLEPSSGGAQFLQDLADKYWGDQIKRMIVGQTLTSQTAPTGMGSEVGKQHRETFDQLVKYDALNLAETISQQMLSVLVDYGYPGITWEPRFEFVLEEQDPRELMEAAKLFIDMGGEASEDEIRDIAGLKKPQKGEKVLGGKAALAAQQPTMPGGDEGEEKSPLDLDSLAAERQGEPERFAKDGPRHAPAGGIIIHGKQYEGGEWIPSDVIDRMTDKQRAVLDAHGQPPGNAESPLKDVPDGDYQLTAVEPKAKPDLLSEAISIMRKAGMSQSEATNTFAGWTEEELQTFINEDDEDDEEAAETKTPENEPAESDTTITPEGEITLYRAANDEFIVGSASFSTDRNAAKSYLNNPGFGGSKLWKTTVKIDSEKFLDLYDDDNAINTVRKLTGSKNPGGIGVDEWVPRIADKLNDAGIEWVRVRESYPEDSETYIFVGGDDPELEEDDESNKFARRKPVAGQQSLAWDESDHPRDDDGKFAEKGTATATATAEPDGSFSLTNAPAKPTPKPTEPHKDTAEQDHLFAGSDWKQGQEELFDPEGSEPDKTKEPWEMSKEELTAIIKPMSGKERFSSPYFAEYERRRDEIRMSVQESNKPETKDIGGFERQLSPASRAKAVAQMNEPKMINGQQQTRKHFIEAAVLSGASVGTKENQRAVVFPDGRYMLQSAITKTAIDYAGYLLEKSSQ